MSREPRHRGRRGKAPAAHSKGTATIGLALIAKDEAEDLPKLLASVEGAFDHVVLVDTGSTDLTVEVFEDWCQRTHQRHTVGTFQWRDDFGAARNHALSLLTTDWTCWADCDDTIHGARNLRRLTATAPAAAAGAMFDYDYVPGVLTIPRERLVRHGRGVWQGRIHEQLMIDGPVMHVPRDVAYWSHRRKTEAELAASLARDQHYFDLWERDEPNHPAVRLHRALEASGR
jgi:glycosyltransferase involved in cell wall biosynthesis